MLDRDLNAARNILEIGRGPPDLKSVESLTSTRARAYDVFARANLRKKEKMKRTLYLQFILIMFVSSYFINFVSGESDVLNEINVAERDIIQGYDAIILAEKNGVNIVNLVRDLNDAIDSLSEARIRYYQGDFEAAFSYLTACKEISTVVREEASALYLSAVEESEKKLFQNSILIRVSIIIIFFSFIFIWKIFKQHYIKKILDMKPMVE